MEIERWRRSPFEGDSKLNKLRIEILKKFLDDEGRVIDEAISFDPSQLPGIEGFSSIEMSTALRSLVIHGYLEESPLLVTFEAETTKGKEETKSTWEVNATGPLIIKDKGKKLVANLK